MSRNVFAAFLIGLAMSLPLPIFEGSDYQAHAAGKPGPNHGRQTRIKDIAYWSQARENQLVGYGLVIGLPGTGDGTRNAPFTAETLSGMLRRLGIATGDRRAQPRNVAAVVVTARLPPFSKPGAPIDITVSSIGDATSLRGGTLVTTSLLGADEQVYAVAQGSVITSGFDAAGQAEAVTQGVNTAATIPGGAIVERASPAIFYDNALQLQLRNPDFATAVSVADAINAEAKNAYGKTVARATDSRVVEVTKPPNLGMARFIARMESLTVHTDQPARVVMNQRTGTVVIGAAVRISSVAVTHGTLTVRVTEEPNISQPNPFSDGVTAEEPRTIIDVAQPGGTFSQVGGSDLQSLINGLNALGVKPNDTIAILQAIKSAGAIQAEVIVK
ncbi:MAG: flagellar basal body P-ring protein FlgI [Ahrensia sp.]|nr:flagellar basal body P-ring protein FlgI [Ahrensia sp.]